MKRFLVPLAIAIGFLVSTPLGQAAAPAGYTMPYNLFVSGENYNQEVPLEKGMQVLESYFSEMPLKPNMQTADQMMTQREFILSFELLRAEAEGVVLEGSDAQVYQQAWLDARRHNWLPEANLTYGTMQEFLYRYDVSQEHAGIPYYEGLVSEMIEINMQRYTSIPQVKNIRLTLLSHINELRLISKDSDEAVQLTEKLRSYYLKFAEVEQQLIELEHPTNKIKNLPDDIRQKIVDNNLNQVMAQMSYSYANNIYNRQFNVVKGAMQLNGRVFQPGENISFTQVLKEGDGGLGGYLSGWAIIGGEEEWTYGGGLCGSATLFFTPSWHAGLEIVARRGHSSYYTDLYPEESKWADATIFFGQTDVIMKNNTSSPVLYYVSDDPEAKEITLYVIGNSPYTEVEIDGPYSSGRYGKFYRNMALPSGEVITDTLETSYSRIY